MPSSFALPFSLLSAAIFTVNIISWKKRKISSTNLIAHIALWLFISIAVILLLRVKVKEHIPQEMENYNGSFLVKISSVTHRKFNTIIHGVITAPSSITGQKIYIFSENSNPIPGSHYLYRGKAQVLDDRSRYNRYLMMKGFTYKHYGTGELITPSRDRSALWLHRVQQNVHRLITRDTSSLAEGFSRALFMARRDSLPLLVIQDFRLSGMMHILAASGMHVGMVTFMPLALISLFRLPRWFTVPFAGIPVLWYIILTGAPVSLLRAGIMFILYTLLSLFREKVNPLNVLFLTGTILLLAMPWELFSPGFQLSFGATLSIILFVKPVESSLRFLPSVISLPLAVSLSAQITVIPLVLYHFGFYSPAGIIMTMVMTPLISLFMLSVFIKGLVLMVVQHTPGILSYVIDKFADIISFIAHEVSTWNVVISLEDSAPILVILVLLPIMLIVLRSVRLIPILLILSTLMTVALTASPGFHKEISLTGKEKLTLITIEKNRLNIRGIPSGDMQFHKTIKQLTMRQWDSVTLTIESTEWKPLVNYIYILVHLPVSRCIFTGDIKPSAELNKLMSIIDKEGISLEIQ